MRLVFTILLVCLCMLPVTAKPLQVSSVRTMYMPRDAWKPIQSYFGSSEPIPYDPVAFSQPDDRTGLYFILTLNQSRKHLGDHPKVKITYQRSDAPQLFTHTWDFPTHFTLTSEFYLGLTGSDWPSEKVTPIAWKVELYNSNTDSWSTTSSFLWSAQ